MQVVDILVAEDLEGEHVVYAIPILTRNWLRQIVRDPIIPMLCSSIPGGAIDKVAVEQPPLQCANDGPPLPIGEGERCVATMASWEAASVRMAVAVGV